MTLPVVLDIAIGLVLVYTLFSIICLALYEIWSRIWGIREEILYIFIHRLIPDCDLMEDFLRNSLIKPLALPKYSGAKIRPSYIPSETFALAFVQVIAKKSGYTGLSEHSDIPSKVESKPDKTKEGSATTETQRSKAIEKFLSHIKVKENKDKIECPKLMDSIQALFANANSMKEAYKNIENWFDAVMERSIGLYKRKSHSFMLIFGFIMAVCMNIDSISIVHSLYDDQTLRNDTFAAATEFVKDPDIKKVVDAQREASAAAEKSEGDEASEVSSLILENQKAMDALTNISEKLQKQGLPLGWQKDQFPPKPEEVPLKLVGFIITALCISLGAPFWFDLLNRFVNLRTSGKAPKPSAGKDKAGA